MPLKCELLHNKFINLKLIPPVCSVSASGHATLSFIITVSYETRHSTCNKYGSNNTLETEMTL